ncbi:QacE family quaternary ammonium compound efflux SMR transporter [Palleronia sediminis]|uniref:QacE family quaternary ammonium compound efflux SMR transporter n=1 Tax=Palleronia sediminis TaxID=2547833 RepID=A0A4R6AKG2_9RHOB|nr:SMR family transporter [Palleronia sediminis]TDL83684.1 QacE family quaternary ammonium compound efflux SMR transporter [Palleronia sediminis]
MVYLYLILAVLLETVGTSALQASQQFTRPLPSVVVVLAYAGAFYLLSLTLVSLPVGVVYALWSGMGILFIAVIGWTVFGQRLDMAAVMGMGLIVAGIAVIQLFSDTTPH